MSTMAEQETVVTSNREEDVVRIWTSNPFHMARLDKEDRAVRVGGDEESASYEVAVKDWNPLGGFKRRVSEEFKAAAAERLAMMKREKNRGSDAD